MTRLIVLTILVILMTALIYNGFRQRQSRIEQQSAKINELEAKLQKATATVVPQNGSLKDQMVCAQQAERAFQSSQRTTNTTGLHLIETHFISHYQPATNRCFVEADASFLSKDGTMTVDRFVSDAIGGDLLGTYMWVNKNKKYWAVKPMMCDMIEASGQTKYCQSDDEFTELARQYMK